MNGRTGYYAQGASLVADARKTMEEAMNSVQRVTGIMTEIEGAAHEQSDGIEQIKAAAAAKSLEAQAVVLREAVAVFRVEATAGAA